MTSSNGISSALTPYLERNFETLDAVDLKLTYIGDESRKMLTGLNVLLASNADKIKALQKNTSGSVTLHLRHCGDKGCIGCPHPSWHLWYNPTKGRDRTKYTSKVIASPLVFLRRKAGADDLRAIIRETQKLIDYRSSLISHVSSLNKTVMRIHDLSPGIIGESLRLEDVRNLRIMEGEPTMEKLL